MVENIQLTMVAEDRANYALWFEGKKGEQLRPGILKIEVSKMVKSTGLALYTVFVWHEGRAWRFSTHAGAWAVAVYTIANMLENWYQALTSGKRWPHDVPEG